MTNNYNICLLLFLPFWRYYDVWHGGRVVAGKREITIMLHEESLFFGSKMDANNGFNLHLSLRN